MSSLIASGRVLDFILLAMATEGAGLTAAWLWRRRGVSPATLWPNLASGMCLLLAMRAALAGAAWGWVSTCLLAALAAHALELRRTWR